MKKLFLAIIGVTILQAEWEYVRFNPWRIGSYGYDDFSDIYFIPNTHKGWAIGASYFDTLNVYHGNIAYTTDGIHWEPQKSSNSPGTARNAVYFVNEFYGWVVGKAAQGGSYPRIYHTKDGGITWEPQYIPDPSGITLEKVKFIDTLRGWTIGWKYIGGGNHNSYLFHTINSGNTWTLQYTFLNFRIQDAIFLDSLNGWVCGFFGSNYIGRVYKTEDGGNTWVVKLEIPITFSFTGLYFYNQAYGWVTGFYPGDNRVYYTTDGGNSWNNISIPYIPLDIFFVDSLTGWIVGGSYKDGRVLRSDNGGINWYEQQIPPPYPRCNTIYAINRNEAWIGCGENGMILYTNNGGNSWYILIGGTERLGSICAVNPLKIWTTGSNTILHSMDGGGSWNYQDIGRTNATLLDIFFIDSLNGVCVGTSGTFYITNNGGYTWLYKNPGIYDWYTCYFLTPLKGWIGGSSSSSPLGGIKYTNDGGNTWIEVLWGNIHVNEITFLNDTSGWACGVEYPTGFGLIAKTKNGINWDTIVIPNSNRFTSIDFVSENIGWVVGDNGTIYKTVDGGQNWFSLSNDTLGTENLWEIDFLDSLNGWIISTNKIFTTQDGGETWRTEKKLPSTTSASRGLSISHDNSCVWACMSDGIILKREIEVEKREYIQNKNIFDILLFPTFCSSYLYIKSDRKALAKLIDISGREIKRIFLIPGISRVPIVELKSGIYFLKINYFDYHTFKTYKFLKK